MPLSTINAAKDLEKSYQPLLVVTLTTVNGQVVRLASEGLNTTEGSFQFNGQNYLGRIAEQDLGAIQGNHEGGIDVLSRISIKVIDPDKVIWLLHQVHGLKGATMQITFLMHEAGTSNYSSDSIVPFEGICEQPECDAEFIYLRATSSLNLQRRLLPAMTLQRRCPLVNPATDTERAEAANEESIFYLCGETRSIGTAAPCDYTKATCTQPNRRAGLEYETATTGHARNYVSGQWLDFTNNPNEQRWGRPIPLVYGTAWVDGLTSVVGEGNSTRGEAILCQGEVEQILKVVVNGQQLQPANDITGAVNYIVRDPLARYNVINRGGRDGSPNLDSPWNGDGDSYGSICAILWVLYNKYADPSTVPSVRALVQGPKIRVYNGTGVGDFTREYSENPVWVILDLLARAGVPISRLDLASFISAADFCDETISYEDQYGATQSHKRYSCSLVISQKQSAADLIRKVRLGCDARLTQNPSTGKIQIFIDSTLATQQPSTISGSNYNSPVTSKTAAGATANGFVAYRFDKVLRIGDKSTLKISGPSQDPPNRVQFDFTNSERDYASDAMAMIDAQAIKAAGRQIDVGLDVLGINTLDQAKRRSRRYLAELNRANARGDAGGSEVYTFLHSFATVRLRPGHICLLNDTQHALTDVPIRLLQIRPARNWETAEIVAQRHVDNHYLNTYGQEADPLNDQNSRNRLERPAYPWAPYKVQPITGDSLVPASEWTFNLAEDHETAAEGTSIAKLIVTGALPVNIFSGVGTPIVGRQGTTDSAGGTILGGGWVYYTAVSAVDADGLLSPPSLFCETAVTVDGDTHTVTMPVLDWPLGTVGYVAYIGNTPQKLTRFADGSGTPSEIVYNSYPEADRGLPDIEFDRFRFKVKRISHSGNFGVQVSSVDTDTLTVDGAAWASGQWIGRDVTLLAKNNGIGDLQVANYRVTANTEDTLTVEPDPVGTVAAGDVIVMRSLVMATGPNWLEDDLWLNSFAPGGLAPDADAGKILRIIAGTGKGDVYRVLSNTDKRIYVDTDWLIDRVPDTTTRYIIEDADWKFIQASDRIDNRDPVAELSFDIQVTNYLRSTLLIMAVAMDGGENEAVERLSPMREIYLFGGPGNLFTSENAVLAVPDRT